MSLTETEVELDLTYALGEIEDIRGALDVQSEGATHILERLEGVEARLMEVTEALVDYAYFAPSNPHSSSQMLRERLKSE